MKLKLKLDKKAVLEFLLQNVEKIVRTLGRSIASDFGHRARNRIE